MAISVVVDPGHYRGYNPGIIPGYSEAETMLSLGFMLTRELEKRGMIVTMTRTTYEANPSLESRGAMAAGKNLFISLHSDASDNPYTRGATIYYSVQRPQSRDFANWLVQFVAATMNTVNNGSRARPYNGNSNRDYYGVLRAAVDAGVGTAFLMEHGYHTNLQDTAFLMNRNNLMQIALTEANVIGMWYGLGWLYTVKPGDTLYSISRKVYVSIERLAYFNNIGSSYLIFPGQVLYIPY